MNNRTFYLTPKQYAWLAKKLPEPITKTKPSISNQALLLGGILYVLKTGCRWQDIPSSICPHAPASCWRRLRY